MVRPGRCGDQRGAPSFNQLESIAMEFDIDTTSLSAAVNRHTELMAQLRNVRETMEALTSNRVVKSHSNPLGQPIVCYLCVSGCTIEVSSTVAMPLLLQHESALARELDGLVANLMTAKAALA
jgi:hypothetical protein